MTAPFAEARPLPNNFDALRLAAAIAVIFAHAFPLSVRDAAAMSPDPGQLAVLVFFSISGYLIAMSAHRAKSTREFIARRIRRIYPGFIVALAFSAFVATPIGRGGYGEYSLIRTAAKWLRDSVLLEKWADPKAFVNNPLPIAVNGSLWTVKYEFGCYLLILAIALIGGLRDRRILLAFTALAYALLIAYHAASLNLQTFRVGVWYLSVADGLLFATTFLVGAVGWSFGDAMPWRKSIAVGFVALIAVAVHSPAAIALVMPVAVPYITFTIAFLRSTVANNFATRIGGDYSYGVYLYAFPIQQLTTMTFGGTMPPLLNFAIATPLALLCGVASWHLVEKHFVRRDRRERAATIVPMP